MGPNEVAELPPYCALMVVDVKNFSGERGRDHERITRQIPVILGETFVRCGLAALWNKVRFQGTTGDGYFLGFKSKYVPFLLNPFLPALQDELDYQHKVADNPSLRMRVVVHVGPMTDTGENTISDGSGDSRVEAHRLIDAEPVRALLSRSNTTTRVAAIVSQRVFEDVVISGYAAESPDLYVPVDVEVKAYQGRAYLRVPRPSGDLLVNGFRPEGTPSETDKDASSREPDQASYPRVVQEQHTGPASTIGIGQVGGNIGTVITGEQSTVHTGSGAQVNGPQLSGDGANYVAGSMKGDIQQKFSKGRDHGDAN